MIFKPAKLINETKGSGFRRVNPEEKFFKAVVVDDDPIILASMKRMLIGNFTVNCFLDAMEALKFIKKENPDIVFTDYNMPGFNGAQLFKKIKAELPEIKIVVLSGDQLDPEMFPGAYGICKKGEFKKLEEIIQNIIQQRF